MKSTMMDTPLSAAGILRHGRQRHATREIVTQTETGRRRASFADVAAHAAQLANGLGTLDPFGYVRLTDRAKDLIKSGGEWISSVELEGMLLAHPDVADVAVIGVPDERWDERPCVVVVPAANAEGDPDALRVWLLGRVARWWIPEYWTFVEALPLTSVGNIDKKLLRSRHEAHDLDVITLSTPLPSDPEA